MNYQPSRTFVFCLATMLASGAAGAWAWNKANSVPMHIRTTSSFLELLRYKEKPRVNPPTPEQIARTREATIQLMEKHHAEFPALRITPHPVPDDQNGFLLLHQLSKEPGSPGLAVTDEFKQLLDGEVPWNRETAGRCLSEHSDLVSRIERIASLPTRSSSNMPDDYTGFIAARTGKYAAEILLLKARLAAESQDEQHALRHIAAAQNIASHYREVETPTLLGETIAILIDLNIRDTVFKHLLPALGRDADLVRWRSVLTPRSYTPAEFAKVLHGEWNTSARFFLLPIILNEGIPNNPPDPEEFARFYASEFNDQIARLPAVSLGQLSAKNEFGTGNVSHLSEKSRQVAESMFTGCNSWANGYIRAASVVAQYQAALDLLTLEKAGTPLLPETTAMITTEPISESPFLFDPATRVLSPTPAAAEADVKPLALPW